MGKTVDEALAARLALPLGGGNREWIARWRPNGRQLDE